MSLPSPEIPAREMIDLSWVTFAEENPVEPCIHEECQMMLPEPREAEWVLTLDCGHEYYFCEPHRKESRDLFRRDSPVKCGMCDKTIFDFSEKPLNRG